MNIPRYDDVSLLLMMELGKRYGENPVSLETVARSHGLSPLFLKKIARTLKQSKLIISHEGKNGGYELAYHPEKISFWDILSAFSTGLNNHERLSECPIGKHCLPQRVRSIMDQTLKTSFSKIYISDIVTTRHI